MTDIEQQNMPEDENRSIVWRPLGLIEVKCTNLHKIIEDGSVNIPKVRGVIPTVISLCDLMIQVFVAFLGISLTFVACLLSIIYVIIKQTFVLTIVILFGVVSILLAIIGVNIQAAMLNSLIGNSKNNDQIRKDF